MKAIVHDTYGSADVLQLRDIDKPEVADDEVLLRVHAAGLDRGVWHLMTGRPYPIRLAGYGLRAPKNPVLGMDVAGVVEAVGAGVTRFQPGHEVFGIGKGAFAEYARAAESKLAPKPANLTFQQAAVVAVSGLTALQALRDHGRVEPGQKVLIIGASGGVGTYAVQLAKVFRAEVTAVCSTTKVDIVQRSPAAGDRAVPIRRPEADDVHLQRELQRPDRPQGADRIWEGHTGHRPDLPAHRGARSHPVPGAGARPSKGRPHRVRHDHPAVRRPRHSGRPHP